MGVLDKSPIDEDRVIERVPHRPILHIVNIKAGQGLFKEWLLIAVLTNELNDEDEIAIILPSLPERVPMRETWHGFGILVGCPEK
jgi:hypothetical protein